MDSKEAPNRRCVRVIGTGGPPFLVLLLPVSKLWVPRSCDFCKDGARCCRKHSVGRTCFPRVGKRVVVPQFDFNYFRLARPWYPPLQRTQEWGTHSCADLKKPKDGPPASKAKPISEAWATRRTLVRSPSYDNLTCRPFAECVEKAPQEF